MRSFSKKLAFVLAAAMVVTVVTPAAQAKAADDFTLNRTEQTLYVNKGVNDKGVVSGGLYGNVQMYDFNLKNKPSNWKDYGYTWTSSNEKVAKVVSGGITTAVGVGTATISCVITDKATGEIATTLTAKVTVKANAKEVIISNAAQYDDQVVEVGDVVDLNRTLVDENGNKSSSKGKYVTDLTKWVAEPNKGVEINQSNGQYTFTEEAVAGDYKLYCYTYQSDKYSQPTATSEAVTVTLSDASFDAVQNTLTKFTMNFGAPVKNLTTNDVEVIRLVEAGSAVYEYPQVVKSVKLADNGLSATVELFSNFQNNVNYVIKVNGFDDYTMTASAGVPVSMTISSNRDAVSPFVTAGAEAQLYYKLYDANNVDVTTGAETVLFNAESYSTDGSYYVAGDKIWFVKAGLSTTVVAEYQSGRFENGIQVGNVTAKFDFHSVDAAPVTLKGVTDATVTSWGNDKTLSAPMGDVVTLKVKVAKSQGDPVEVTSNGQDIGIGSITFEETTPDVLAINKTDMKLLLFKQGVANIIVNLETIDGNGNTVKTPVGVVQVTVAAPRALSTVTVDKALTTVGTSAGYTTEIVKLTANDQYGKPVTISSVTFSGTNDAANNVIAGVSYIGENKIQLDGDVLKAALVNNANAIQLTYKAKVNNSKEVTFSVLVKKANDNANTNYINIETTGGFGEVARTVDSKNAKSVTFTVYVMNNGIKIGTQEVAAYPANIADAEVNNYYFKVTKNGEDITNRVTATTNGAILNFSSLEEVTNGAVSGSAVKYDLGAGNYAFTLYKCIQSGTTKVLVQQNSATGVATCNTGSYSAAVRVKDKVDAVDQASIRACFEVKDTKGNNATAPYFVDYDTADNAGYVFVKSITFYDKVADDEYAAYTVNVGVSLRK